MKSILVFWALVVYALVMFILVFVAPIWLVGFLNANPRGWLKGLAIAGLLVWMSGMGYVFMNADYSHDQM